MALALRLLQRAQAQLRAAYGSFLPNADGSIGLGFREGRPQNFGGVNIGASNDILSSSWNLSASSRLSWNTLNQLKRADAGLDAADADVTASRYSLRAQVTQQFLLALQTQARAALQDTLADKVGAWVTVIIGAIFVICVLAFRRGIVGEILAWRERRKKA